MSDAGDVRDTVAAYWAALDARDWDTFGAVLAEDVVYEVPQTRERVRGRAAFTVFTSDGFPGDWHVTVRRIVASDQDAASEIDFTDAGVSQTGLTFFRFGPDGLISRITDYWPEPYEPPANRAGLAERY
jgi:ketosteroid isomerase-like protein